MRCRVRPGFNLCSKYNYPTMTPITPHLFSRCAFGLVLSAILTSASSNSLVAADSTSGTSSTGTIAGEVRNEVTDQFLNKARVVIVGTGQEVLTDSFGVFRLVGVPSGSTELEIFYTGLDIARVTVIVPAGGAVRESVALTSVARYGANSGGLKLDPYVVSADKETDAQAIATNEQRFSPNIKNVLATDALGDVLGSSVGEFLKFVPGVTAEYDNADISSVSVRGMGGDKTAVTVNGAPGSSSWVGASRTVDLRSMALNDISRIEVTKVPTPSTPADSLGGSVNFVSKSAFESRRRQIRVGLSMMGNSYNTSFNKTPTPYLDEMTRKLHPGINLDFTWPITKRFGIVLTGLSNDVYSESTARQTNWIGVGTGTNAISASLSNPFVRSYNIQGGFRTLTRNSLSLKADWKVSEYSVLSLSSTFNRSTTKIGNTILNFDLGTVGTPTVAGGTPLTWGPTFTVGATGRGAIQMSGNAQKIPVNTDTHSLNYRYDNGYWRVEAGLSRSDTTIERIYAKAGFFWQSLAVNNVPVRITYQAGSEAGFPAAINAYDNSNQPFDWHKLQNYRGTNGLTGELKDTSEADNTFVNVRRALGMFSFPAAIQAGASERQRVFDTTGTVQTQWTFTGPDGRSGATASMVPYRTQVFKGDFHSDPLFFGTEWLSARQAWLAFQENPLLYTKTSAQIFATENSRLNTSEYFKETVSAGYLQGEVDLLSNRLKLLGGVRYEKTKNLGLGRLTNADGVWQRDASGNYVRTSTGARIRKPEAGAANSMEQLRVTSVERGAVAHRTFDGYYPSFHVTYDIAENLLVRLAYAKTYGRPNLTDIVPRTVATSADLDSDDPTPAAGRGTLTIRNAALNPWTADNYDLSLEYYDKNGGMISAGVFLKEIKDFFGTGSRLATEADLAELNLDGNYLDWVITTNFNAGDARVRGAEFNLRYPLRALGSIGEHFVVFANATKLELEGGRDANFSSFIPKSANWGLTFSQKKLSLTARWNYRGLDKRAPQPTFGPDGYEYIAPRTTFDVSANYILTRRFSLTASVSNLLNEPLVNLRYGSGTPAHARVYWVREFGAQFAVGIKGVF